MAPPIDWHPRRLAVGTEWLVSIPGQPEPLAVIRRLTFEGRVVFRAVTWAPTSGGRSLIGYYPSSDEAAVAIWRKHCDDNRSRHEQASRTHGSRERGGGTSSAP